jgi:hypothetical protein
MAMKLTLTNTKSLLCEDVNKEITEAEQQKLQDEASRKLKEDEQRRKELAEKEERIRSEEDQRHKEEEIRREEQRKLEELRKADELRKQEEQRLKELQRIEEERKRKEEEQKREELLRLEQQRVEEEKKKYEEQKLRETQEQKESAKRKLEVDTTPEEDKKLKVSQEALKLRIQKYAIRNVAVLTLHRYYLQLTQGCGRDGCPNLHCASHTNSPMPYKDAVLLSFQLAKSDDYLCERFPIPDLPPSPVVEEQPKELPQVSESSSQSATGETLSPAPTEVDTAGLALSQVTTPVKLIETEISSDSNNTQSNVNTTPEVALQTPEVLAYQSSELFELHTQQAEDMVVETPPNDEMQEEVPTKTDESMLEHMPIITLSEIQDYSSPTAFEKGSQLADAESVQSCFLVGNRLQAQVGDYSVRITCNDIGEVIFTQCTCLHKPNSKEYLWCSHIVCTLITCMNDVRTKNIQLLTFL